MIAKPETRKGEQDMLRKRALVRVLACALLAIGTWGQDVLVAGEATAGAEAKPEDIRPDIAKFKGFLVGEIVSVSDTGVVLKVRSVTIVEGSQAANPTRLLGREVPVEFATEKDKDGKEQPAKWLADTVRVAQKGVWLGGFGALGAPNQMVITNIGGMGREGVATATVVVGGGAVGVAGGAGEAGQGNAARVGGRIAIGGPDGAQIEVALPEDEGGAARPDEKGKKQAPRLLARVQADEKGTLVTDRVAPGTQVGHEWDTMPKVRMIGVPAPPPQPPEAPQPPQLPGQGRKESDF
jgi:hypothetical protein